MDDPRPTDGRTSLFAERVAVIGVPDSMERFHANGPAVWSRETLAGLKNAGFTRVQLNLAWGARPNDEPLNLEDLVEPTPAVAARSPQKAEANCRPGDEARRRRRALIAERLTLARESGLKTLFHFGAPYNRHLHYGDTPPNCLCDPAVQERYEDLIRRFAADFPGVDDLLVYTYDQDAWICGEFGGCPRCNGVPLHERLPAFLDRLRQTWRSLNPAGRLWWEPWELSAGQIHGCLERMSPDGFGLSLHANIAECMAAVAADPWFVRTARQARDRGIPVWAEWFLGGVSEETEPIPDLAHPLTIWRGLQKLHAVPGVTGLKEYYGLRPERLDEDDNLQATILFLREPGLSEAAAVGRLAARYGKAADAVAVAWRLASEGMERYPWDCSWIFRQVGDARTDHALSAAILRPMVCPTPSWQSTRGTIYMRTEDTPATPWLLEDVGLRAQQAADLWQEALAGIERATALASGANQERLRRWRDSLATLRRRAVAHACHLRATLIAIAARRRLQDKLDLPPRCREEMRSVLDVSRANHAEECRAAGRPDDWPEMDEALRGLEGDFRAWLDRWFQPAPDKCSKGWLSPTSA